MPTKPGFYAVRVGRCPGVYNTWDDCLEQVKGFSDARFKKFERREEALNFIKLPPSPKRCSVSSPPLSESLRVSSSLTAHPANIHVEPITKKRRREHDESQVRDKPLNDADLKTTTERPTKKSKHRDTSIVHSNLNNTALRDFLSLAKYKNPAVLTKLERVGFGSHELLTMKGLREGPIARRFRHLIGRDSNSAAQVESLAFAVANATADAWNDLERHC